MKAVYPRILLTLLCLLTLATSASAECAWVLWEEEERTDANDRSQTSWRINDAVPGHTPPGSKVSGYDLCRAMTGPISQLLADNSQPGPNHPNVKEVRTSPGLVIVILKGKRGDYGGQVLTRFLCPPDTVDPRGVKGK